MNVPESHVRNVVRDEYCISEVILVNFSIILALNLQIFRFISQLEHQRISFFLFGFIEINNIFVMAVELLINSTCFEW